jgi:hypothetical protein
MGSSSRPLTASREAGEIDQSLIVAWRSAPAAVGTVRGRVPLPASFFRRSSIGHTNWPFAIKRENLLAGCATNLPVDGDGQMGAAEDNPRFVVDCNTRSYFTSAPDLSDSCCGRCPPCSRPWHLFAVNGPARRGGHQPWPCCPCSPDPQPRVVAEFAGL